jgi:hypothetical protein
LGKGRTLSSWRTLELGALALIHRQVIHEELEEGEDLDCPRPSLSRAQLFVALLPQDGAELLDVVGTETKRERAVRFGR